jgi:hypothetical protein
MLIDIIQFIPPRGRQELRQIEVPDDCAVGYESMRRHGCRLTVETLMTGMVSTCIEHEEGDYDIKLLRLPGRPGKLQTLPQAVTAMLQRFDGAKFEKWLEEVRA